MHLKLLRVGDDGVDRGFEPVARLQPREVF
jgi:hypothetical protein